MSFYFLRANSTFCLPLGQMFAMMRLAMRDLPSFLAEDTFTRFSCQRRVAHVFTCLSGANFATTTQSNLAALRTLRAASPVFRKLNGDPSMKATTTDWAVLRPRDNSALAARRAKATSL